MADYCSGHVGPFAKSMLHVLLLLFMLSLQCCFSMPRLFGPAIFCAHFRCNAFDPANIFVAALAHTGQTTSGLLFPSSTLIFMSVNAFSVGIHVAD